MQNQQELKDLQKYNVDELRKKMVENNNIIKGQANMIKQLNKKIDQQSQYIKKQDMMMEKIQKG